MARAAREHGDGAKPADVVVNLVADPETFHDELIAAELVVDDDSDLTTIELSDDDVAGVLVTATADPERFIDRRCETSSGTPVPPKLLLQAALAGHIRRVLVDSQGVVIDWGRRRRLFTGPAREAALLLVGRCEHPGCEVKASYADVDHMIEWHAGGRTDQRNGAVLDRSHNRFEHRARWRIRRDGTGRKFFVRADGTIVLPVGAREPVLDDAIVDARVTENVVLDSPTPVAARTSLALPVMGRPVDAQAPLGGVVRTGLLALAGLGLTACAEATLASAPAVVEDVAPVVVDDPTTTTTAPTTTTTTTTLPPTTTTTTTTLPPTTTTTVPPVPVADPPIVAVGTGNGDDTRAAQQRLLELGFWLEEADGSYGLTTRQAVMAFQKYYGLATDGVLGAETAELMTSLTERPTARADAGTMVEIDKGKQVLFFVIDGRPEWILNVSSGSEIPYREPDQNTPGEWQEGDSVTRNGLHAVYRERNQGWWEGDLGSIYRPKYFTGGIAVHGSNHVPDYPASHGCVRVSVPAMDWIWETGIMPMDTPVWVHEGVDA